MTFSNFAFQIFVLNVILSISVHSYIIKEEPEFSYPDVFNDPMRDALITGTFRDDFVWGVGTSAYQIEGAWNIDGKGESIWDNFTHVLEPRCWVNNCENGDVACDSYHKYETDVKMLKDLGVTHYRFSVSWSRIMPTGEGEVNELGLQYYDKLIDALIAEGIEPVITLYTMDLPQSLQDKYGGWEGRELAEKFNAYADTCFERWADKVNMWITFSDPHSVCDGGYGSFPLFAPGIEGEDDDIYRCAHNIIRSHGMAYRTYESKYKTTYEGQVSISLHTEYASPEDPDNITDVQAANNYMQFRVGWFAHPIVINGDYPDIMKQRLGARLPEFTVEEKKMVNGTADFFGLIAFTSCIVRYRYVNWDEEEADESDYPQEDIDDYYPDEWQPSSSGFRPVPWGMRGLLNWVKDEYNLPVYITENGVPTAADSFTDDESRVTYYKAYLNEALKAYKEDGVDLRGYFAWSLMDNFEWALGYSQRFGLYHVDFEDDNRPRTRKKSADYYSQLIKDNGFSSASKSTVSLLLLLISVCVKFLH